MYIYNTTRKAPIKRTNSINLTLENQKYIDELKLFLKTKTGSGSMLRKFPLPEMHLNLPNNVPSENIENGSFNNTGKYSYCGPGTKVQKRLKERYKGINSLDKACKQHDINYFKNK